MGANYFSKGDASSAYWQIKIDRQSSNLLTLGTIISRFNFKRVTYGVHSTSEIFQKTVSSIVSYIQGSQNSQNGIITWGKTLAEHDSRQPLGVKYFSKGDTSSGYLGQAN